MNKPLTATELEALQIPAPYAAQPMTREEKFSRWEKLVREYQGDVRQPIEMERSALRVAIGLVISPTTPLSVAADDPEFKAQGLTSADQHEVGRFFQVSQQGLHWMMCSCHGEMGKDEMAKRISIVGQTEQFRVY